MIREQ